MEKEIEPEEKERGPKQTVNPMNPMPNRVVVYAKDVSNITGLRRRAAAKLLANVRCKFGKEPSAFVTVSEFAAATGIAEEVIRPFLI